MTLNEIVSNSLDVMSLGENEFTKCYRLAQRGIRQMKWDFIGTIKTENITVLGNMTAKLPEDFVSERLIRAYNEPDTLHPLSNNPKLSLSSAQYNNRFYKPGVFTSDAILDQLSNLVDYGDDDDDDQEPYIPQSSAGDGEYRVDLKSNTIVFSPNFRFRYIQVEYLSNTKDDGKSYVPEMVSEALLAFIVWQYNFAKKGVNYADKVSYKNHYYNELRKAKLRLSKITKQQMWDLSRVKVENI